ncbi:MAG: AraC family transcriptional regulator [Prolixibacteraceae bacterium]|nr:AraC family transcriptional regulator [Prolixibacteraceae bacterium]
MIREIIVLTPIYISLFWSLVFLTNKFSVNKARYWLGIFMLVVAVLYGCHAAYFLGYKELYLKIDSLYLLTGLSVYPMYYIYVRLLTCDLSIKSTYILHFLPAVVLFSALLLTGSLLNTANDLKYYESVLIENRWPGHDAAPLLKLRAAVFFLSRIIFGLQTLIYLSLGFLLAKKYNQRIANFYSNMEGRELVWVKLLTASFLITSVASFVVNALGRGLFFNNNLILAIPAALFSTLFFIIGLQANQQNFTIKTLDEDEGKDIFETKSVVNLQNNKLKSNLLKLLEKEKIYQQPELKITDLCKKLNTNRTYLSNLINNDFQLSYNDFINQYRVNHAISMLQTESGKTQPLSDIAHASGFGSLSSFNRAFKKHKGVTISTFKKEN